MKMAVCASDVAYCQAAFKWVRLFMSKKSDEGFCSSVHALLLC